VNNSRPKRIRAERAKNFSFIYYFLSLSLGLGHFGCRKMALNTCSAAVAAATTPAKGAPGAACMCVFNLFGRLPAPGGARSQITRRAFQPALYHHILCAL